MLSAAPYGLVKGFDGLGDGRRVAHRSPSSLAAIVAVLGQLGPSWREARVALNELARIVGGT